MKKIFLFFLIYPLLVFSQQYLWPTNASPYMTSSFCEYRPGHYHSAIDIKTWNREGYPIYAVEDGSIYKIRVSPFGYGKVLYLKLKDGRLAVYGHLQKFTPEIDRIIRKLQIKNKRYSVTWKPKSWPVKKGQVLGFTGQTGIGVPHLHFEIRSDENHPMNPLRFYPQVQDHLAPRLQSLLVIPQNAQSRVNQTFLPQVIPLQEKSPGHYVLSRPIHAFGEIGLALHGYDRADGVYNKFSFYTMALDVNKIPVFKLRYDTLDFTLTRQVDVEIYYPFKADSGKVFHKLYIEPYNKLPFYRRELGTGLIQVWKDTVAFQIIVSDFFGNQSLVEGKIVPRPEAFFALTLNNRLPELALLNLVLPRGLNFLRFFYDAPGHSWQSAEYFEILRRQYYPDRQEMLVRLPLPAEFNSRVKIQFGQNRTPAYERIISLKSVPHKETRFNVRFLNNRLVLAVRPPLSLPNMRLVMQTTERHFDLPLLYNPQEWQAVLPARLIPADTFRVTLEADGHALFDTSLSVFQIPPGQSSVFSFFQDTLQIAAVPASVYDTLLFSPAVLTIPDSIARRRNILSHMFRFQNASCVLKKPLEVRIKIQNNHYFWRQLGLYALDNEGELHYLGGEADSLAGIISGRVHRLQTMVCAADTVAPDIKILQPAAKRALSELSLIQFELDDSLSGIGSETNIAITIDDRFVVPEWDPERHVVVGRPHWKLEPGSHLLKIRVTDQAGNVGTKSVSVQIK